MAICHPKANKWVLGRRNIFDQLKQVFKDKSIRVVWIHCASLGEFEQGRPLIETLKESHPSNKILLTFFSPSGYEAQKHYPLADYIFYLPLDSPKNARQFIHIVQPNLVFFVKYEFWYFYLKEIQQQNIPVYLIAGIFKSSQLFFKPYGKWYLKIIKGFDQLFLQDENSLKIAQEYGLTNGVVVGDTRIDRVAKIAKDSIEMPIIESFKSHMNLMILGSTHLKDEVVFFDFLKIIKQWAIGHDWKYLIAPHELSDKVLNRIETSSSYPIIRFSKIDKHTNFSKVKILILDTIGHLSAAYQYGDLVYIGGGFNSGIHNILEPIVFGLPVVFGPNYNSFKEANELIQEGGAFSITSSKQLAEIFDFFQEKEIRKSKGELGNYYIQKNNGATKKIFYYLIKKNVL